MSGRREGIRTGEGLFGVRIYALGIEAMLSASQEVPLQYAVTERLEYQRREVGVIDSEVLLEIENSVGSQRQVDDLLLWNSD